MERKMDRLTLPVNTTSEEIALDGVMKLLWKEADEDRNKKLESAVEEMITDEQARGVHVIEDFFGRLIDVRLDHAVPFGTVVFIRKDLYSDLFVPPPERGGGET